MKTLAVSTHLKGPFQNGVDRCHARHGDGMCPGVRNAEWLNNLGDDDEEYSTIAGRRVTNGEVRSKWFDSNMHVRALEPERAELLRRKAKLEIELHQVNRRLKDIGVTEKVS